MTEKENGPALTVAAEQEERTQTWTILRRRDDSQDSQIVKYVWEELGELSDSGRYGYWPSAHDIGDRWGVGHYMLVERDRSYPSCRFETVVGTVVYEFAQDEEEAE